MGRKRRFKPEPDERAVDVTDEANVTEEEAEKIAAKFTRKYGSKYPRLAAALNAESDEDADNST